VDIGKLTFTVVEQFYSMPTTRGGPYSMTMLQNYYLHEVSVSSNGTRSDEEDSHSNDEQGSMVETQEA
jgi:hypothetical protein